MDCPLPEAPSAAQTDCPACVDSACTWGEGCIVDEAFGPTDSEKRRQEARSAASPRIRFTIAATTTLEPLWYDEQWHRELVADGLTDEQALRAMIEEGFQEDGISILWEMFGPPPETAKYFAQAVTEVCLV